MISLKGDNHNLVKEKLALLETLETFLGGDHEKIVIGSRNSPLAIIQSEILITNIRKNDP